MNAQNRGYHVRDFFLASKGSPSRNTGSLILSDCGCLGQKVLKKNKLLLNH